MLECKVDIKCCDDDNPIPLTHYRRGHAGVAIIWKNEVDHLVHPISEEGNNRILVARLGKPKKTQNVLIINTYMPSGNEASALDSYRDILDRVYDIIDKYQSTDDTLLVGDMNGSLNLPPRCSRDRILGELCRGMGLKSL